MKHEGNFVLQKPQNLSPSESNKHLVVRDMSKVTAAYLIEKFNLIPHPEGGFYGESFRSEDTVSIDREDSKAIKRSASTAIYFLILPGNISRLHRINSDEGKYLLYCYN